MTRTIFQIRTDAGEMYASADLVEAGATIYTYFGDDPHYEARGDESDNEGFHWAPTPYQTADARHIEGKMAALVADYCDMGDVLSVQHISD